MKPSVMFSYIKLKPHPRIDKVSPSEGVEITVISGESHGVTGFVRPVGGCWYFDFKLTRPGATVFQPIPAGWTSFIYGKSDVHSA